MLCSTTPSLLVSLAYKFFSKNTFWTVIILYGLVVFWFGLVWFGFLEAGFLCIVMTVLELALYTHQAGLELRDSPASAS